MLAIISVIDRVSLGDTEHTAIFNVVEQGQADVNGFPLREFDQVRVRRVPQLVALCAKVLEAQTCLAWVRNHVRAPVLEILNPAHLDGRIVNVNPIVGKQVDLINDEAYGEEIAVM